jgi:hypothetical protein
MILKVDHIDHKTFKLISQSSKHKSCKSAVLNVGVYQKNASLANLIVNVLIAVVNLKKTDVVAGRVLMPL